MEGQISLNDFLSRNVALGYCENVVSKTGKTIPFQELKKYIGKKVLYGTRLKDGKQVGKVVMITSYMKDMDTFYSLEEDGKKSFLNDFVYSLSSKETKEKARKAFVCDRIAYTDDERTKKTNSWLSEAYCVCGRYDIHHIAQDVCFYEYKAI